MFNALTFDENIFGRACGQSYSRVFYAGEKPLNAPNAVDFLRIDENFGGELRGNLYLDTVLLPDPLLEKVIDYALSTKCRLIINACSTLDEAGTCDKLYGATPIGLAYRYGLLDGAYVAGGVYLDKDDIELIVGSGAEVILTPSLSMGEGYGIPPLRMLASLGATVRLGTGTADYNPDADLVFEQRLLAFAVCGVNCTKNAVDERFLRSLIAD